MSPVARGDSVSIPWMIWGLVVPLIVYAAGMVDVLTLAQIPFDSEHTYLPLAQRLLEDAPGVWRDPDFYKVAPGAVVYMALADADPVTIKTMNLAISLAALVLSFDAARRIGGVVAASAAAWLYALPSMLSDTGATLLGESPFIFLVALWLWGTAVAAGPHTSPRAARWRNGAVLLAGLALAAATLTRATYMYWIPFAAVAFSAASLRLQGPSRAAAARIAAVHLIAAVLVGAYMVRQNEAFGRPIVATGSGAALYFGSNPVLFGYEPPFFGLGHDASLVTGDQGHLSLEGDQRLVAVTKAMLADLPTGALLKMYVRKLGAILFFSRAHLDRQVMNDRAWRVVLVLLSVLGLWGARRHPLLWMVGGAAAYQCAVHVPVLYNPRYSISALDVLFVLLAAQGAAWLWSRPRRGMAVSCAGLAIAGGIALGNYHQHHSRPLLPDFRYIPPLLLQAAQPSELSVSGWDGDPFAAQASMPTGTATVEWAVGGFQDSLFTMVHLGMPRFEGRCETLRLTHLRSDGAQRSTLVSLEGLRQGQDINWGLIHLMLPGTGSSRLRLEFECDAGTRMQFDGMGFYQASPGRHYLQRALHP
ncbi:hypothetical protein M5C99_04745 [Acidovorax sp. NCPPB 2350]|nr:hypothetical protein M5C99_04745 [Acidovorax sp. NCPPB 2350]